ncbi:MAG: hypothetical protein P1V35_13705 [Planctomycetota bacterium]|nr:hypothetical protein [Planctomycetota bacterium]
MNRTTAILLALGILLAHSLGIHRDFQWNFAGPYDSAHLAFALGENAAQGNGWNLSPGGPGLQAYPSPLWVGLAWLATWFEWPVGLFAQMVGLFSALLLISASTRIAQDRVAGVIPPVLLVLSGTMASGAVSGTEHVTLALLLVIAVVSFEKKHPIFLMLALALMALTRAEGLIMVAAWFAFWSVDRIKGEKKRDFGAWVFAPAALIGGFFCWFTPNGEAHSLYGAVYHRLLESEAMGHGWTQALDFTKVAISPIWMLLGLGFVLSGKLSGPGIRAFLLSCLYMFCMVRAGGEDLPFGLAFLPALPLICLVIQEMIVAALDTYRPGLEAICWVLLLFTSLAAATASKFPGDVGPLSLGTPHTEWLQARSPVSLGQNSILGRTQLQTEIRRTSEMRRVAHFLAEHLDPDATVLSPWVGSLSYHTPNRIYDWFSRLQTIGDTPQRFNLGYPAGAPLANALANQPDLVLPAIGMGAELSPGAFPKGLNPVLLELGGDSPEAKEALAQAIHDKYSLVALPIAHPTSGRATPFLVYQSLESSARPQLEIHGTSDSIRVEAILPDNARAPLPQMVYVVVHATDEGGKKWIAQPSGQLVRASAKQASSAPVVLNSTSAKRVRLWAGDLTSSPTGSRILRIEARLYHPRINRKAPLAPASTPVFWEREQ